MTGGERAILVFASGDKNHRKVRQLIEHWTRLGLLQESIWIEPAHGRTSGTRFDREGPHQIDVASHLAGRDLSKLRLITFHVVGGADEAAKLPSGRESFEAQDPYRQLAAEAGVEYAAGVVVATLPDLPVPGAVFDSEWQFNLVVVPEDRSSDGRTAVLVTRETLPGLAACNLASVAGLWCWATDTVIDTLGPRGGKLSPDVHLVRSLVLVVDGGSKVDEITDTSLQLDEKSGCWPVPSGTEAKVAEEPDEVVARVVGEFGGRFGLHYLPITKEPLAPPVRMTLWQGLKYFVGRVLEILGGLPARWVRRKVTEVERGILQTATDLTFGEKSQVVLTLRGHSLPAGGADSTGSDRLREMLRVKVRGADPKLILPEPELWSAFADVGCALADAGVFPEGITPPIQGATRLLAPWPDYIAPDPDPDLAFRLSGVELQTNDAFGAAELERCLLEAIKQAQDGPAEDALDAPAGPDNPPPDEDEGDYAPGSDDEEPDEADSDSATSEEPQIDGPDLSALREQAQGHFVTVEDLAGQSPEALQGQLHALEQWTCERHRRESFAWGVGGAIGQGIVDASQDLATALDVIRGGPPGFKDKKEEERKRRFRRSAVRVGLIGLILVLGVVGVALAGLLSILISAVLAAVVFLFSFWRLLRHVIEFATDEARAQFERNQALRDYDFAPERVAHAAKAVTRLCALYWQYLDWSRLLAHVTRHPRGRRPDGASLDAIMLKDAPLAITLGTAEMSDDTFQHNVAAARREVTRSGWLGTYVRRYLSLSKERYRVIEAVPENEAETAEASRDTAPLDAVRDTHSRSGEQVYSPRCQARRDIEGDRFSAAELAADTERVFTYLSGEGIERLFSHVALQTPGAGPSGPKLLEFLGTLTPSVERPPSFLPANVFRIQETVKPDSVWLTMPAELAGDPNPRCLPATWTLSHGQRFVAGSHRVDLYSCSDPAQLSLVQSPEAASGPPEGSESPPETVMAADVGPTQPLI